MDRRRHARITGDIGEIADTREANRALVQRHYEKLAAGDWQAAADDYSGDAANFGHPVRREGFRRVFEDIYETFPIGAWKSRRWRSRGTT